MNISESEQQLLDILWKQNPLTVGQLIERVQVHTDWHANTIKTMLTRLTKKGAITRAKDGGRYFYSPGITREDIVLEETEGFLARFFDGKLAPLVAHFASKKEMSKEDLAEIESVLAALKKNDD